MRKAIFIDRDGVINRNDSPYEKGTQDKELGPDAYILKWEDFEFLPGVFEAFRLIKESEYVPIIVSNQSCIGKRYTDSEEIQVIFSKMEHAIWKAVGLNVYSYCCPHTAEQKCACRKPKPFMLGMAAIEHNIILENSWMIGDSDTDIEAGFKAGIPPGQCIKIGEEGVFQGVSLHNQLTGKVEVTFLRMQPSLLDAVRYILSRIREV